MTILHKSIATTAVALLLAAAASHAQTAYTIGDNGVSLVRFQLATPTITTVVGPISGAVNVLQGIDFRPADGLLYGFSTGGQIVTVNPNTAATTLVSTSTVNSTTGNLGIDFNPAADRLRLVNELDQNLRIDVTTGAATVDGLLAYAAGDPNVNANPSIIDVAYLNNDTNPGTGTVLYYIDNSLDTLVTTINPNAGSLTTVGPLGFGTNDRTGFDIFTDALGLNTAYALLTAPAGTASLYTVNLTTGAATSVGAIGASAVRPYGLAITPVPEPATALFGLALVGVALSRRARQAAPRA